MFIARFLAPRNPATTTATITTPRRSKMFQRRAPRRRRISVPSTRLTKADFLQPQDDEVFPVTHAIAYIDVVGVEPDLPPEAIRPADIVPQANVDSPEVARMESVNAAPGMAPMANVPAAEAVPADEIVAPLPAIAANAVPVVSPASEIVVAVPAMLAVEDALGTVAPPPIDVAPTSAHAIPSTLRKAKKRGRKRENVGLGGGAGMVRKQRRKSAKKSSASGTAEVIGGRLPGYGRDGTSGAHSPP
jgi:hypothetical protein